MERGEIPAPGPDADQKGLITQSGGSASTVVGFPSYAAPHSPAPSPDSLRPYGNDRLYP